MDTHLFIEILKTRTDLTFIRTEERNGVQVELYDSDHTNRSPIIIDVSDDDIPDSVIAGYLIQLGLSELIPSLCPNGAILPQTGKIGLN